MHHEQALVAFACLRLTVDLLEERPISDRLVINVGYLARAINSKLLSPTMERWTKAQVQSASQKLLNATTITPHHGKMPRRRYHPYNHRVHLSPLFVSKPIIILRSSEGDILLDGYQRAVQNFERHEVSVEALIISEADAIRWGTRTGQLPEDAYRVLQPTLVRPAVTDRVHRKGAAHAPYRAVAFQVPEGGLGRRPFEQQLRRLADFYHLATRDLINTEYACSQNRIRATLRRDYIKPEHLINEIQRKLGYNPLYCTYGHFEKEWKISLARIHPGAESKQYDEEMREELAKYDDAGRKQIYDQRAMVQKILLHAMRVSQIRKKNNGLLKRIEDGEARVDITLIHKLGIGDNIVQSLSEFDLEEELLIARYAGVLSSTFAPDTKYRNTFLKWEVFVHHLRRGQLFQPDLAMLENYLQRRAMAILGEVDHLSPVWSSIFGSLSDVDRSSWCDQAALQVLHKADQERWHVEAFVS